MKKLSNEGFILSTPEGLTPQYPLDVRGGGMGRGYTWGKTQLGGGKKNRDQVVTPAPGKVKL